MFERHEWDIYQYLNDPDSIEGKSQQIVARFSDLASRQEHALQRFDVEICRLSHVHVLPMRCQI